MTTPDYPLLFEPVYKDYIWGGRRIASVLGRRIKPGICAESWEISDRPEGMSIVVNGPAAGRSLGELVAESGGHLLGRDCAPGRFPLLVKVIDARERLSVQVHPPVSRCAESGVEPKTEMWYSLPGGSVSKVFAGLAPGVTRDRFEAALREKTVEGLLQTITLQPSEAVLIPGGLVHCIDAGSLLFEVQQNSNTTYRVYDWDRVGPDGKGRPLHVREAMEAIDWGALPPRVTRPERVVNAGRNRIAGVLHCRHFRVDRIDLAEALRTENDGAVFHAFFTTAGNIEVSTAGGTVSLGAGVSCLLPASVPVYTLSPQGGPAQVLRIRP